MNGRPKELADKLRQISSDNDSQIIQAIEKIEASSKIKATILSVARMAKVHPNTVRNRPWVKERLILIKQKRKQKTDLPDDQQNPAKVPSTEEVLLTRVKALLEQNALLYQEVIDVQAAIRKKDREIDVLSRRLRMKEHSPK